MINFKQNSYFSYKNEYSKWRAEKDFNKAKRQEYLRRNPEAIKDYDLQRAKILLSAVDMMDKSISEKNNFFGTSLESLSNIGLGYGAVGGTALGFLVKKSKPVKKFIDKIIKKYPKSNNIITAGYTAISGILGILAIYPIYAFLSQIQSTINRKRRFDTMEKELQDSKIFVVLDNEQKKLFKKNLEEIKSNKGEKTKNFVKNELKNTKQIIKEAIYYDKNQTKFREKYKENEAFYNEKLTDKEIRNAKKDKVLLSVLIKELNTTSQSYTENMDKITNNLISTTFGLGSLFVLGYERIAQKLKLKYSSFPVGLGFSLFVASTIFGTWATKKASEVGRFKARQQLMKNPEQLIYISNRKTETINDDEIAFETKKNRKNSFKFIKEFFKNNKEYKNWKKNPSLTGKDIVNAMENIEISPEQMKDGKRLQKNMFKTFYKVDNNTQNYSSKIQLLNESIKYPITLALGTLGSVWGLKHLAKIRMATKASEVFENTAKYIFNILLFIAPTYLINSYFANMQKMGARISDMITMKELEDYRFFADYSRFKEESLSP